MASNQGGGFRREVQSKENNGLQLLWLERRTYIT